MPKDTSHWYPSLTSLPILNHQLTKLDSSQLATSAPSDYEDQWYINVHYKAVVKLPSKI